MERKEKCKNMKQQENRKLIGPLGGLLGSDSFICAGCMADGGATYATYAWMGIGAALAHSLTHSPHSLAAHQKRNRSAAAAQRNVQPASYPLSHHCAFLPTHQTTPHSHYQPAQANPYLGAWLRRTPLQRTQRPIQLAAGPIAPQFIPPSSTHHSPHSNDKGRRCRLRLLRIRSLVSCFFSRPRLLFSCSGRDYVISFVCAAGYRCFQLCNSVTLLCEENASPLPNAGTHRFLQYYVHWNTTSMDHRNWRPPSSMTFHLIHSSNIELRYVSAE